MATNTNIPAQKKVVSVEILHLDDLGYGPQGKHTRREWRAECLEHLLASKEQFKAWLEGWKSQIDESLEAASFGVITTYTDGSKQEVLNEMFSKRSPYDLDFVGHVFDDPLDCKGFVFKQRILFTSATFSTIANFEGTVFSCIAEYEYATFSDLGIFTNSEFNDVSFSGTLFNNVNFNNTRFLNHYANFNSSIFKSTVDFEGSIFPFNFMSFLNISFVDAEFQKHASFRNIVFNVKTNFNNAKFTTVDFENSKFKHQINFEAVCFGRDAVIYDVAYPKINFINTEFDYDAKFNYSIFSISTDFIKANFVGDADFNNVEFKKDVRFFGVKFNGGVFFNNSVFIGDAVKRLGQMKRIAEEHGQTDQALNFNAMELRAKRKQVEPQAAHWSFKVVTLLYEIVSDYGRSFLRPLLAYGVLIVCSLLLTLPFTDYSQDASPVTVANRAICLPKNKEEAAKQLQLTYKSAAFEYAVSRAIGVLDFTNKDKQNIIVNCTLFGQPFEPTLMRVWGIFNAIASTALLFLAALGLRNKYRIK